MKVALIGSGGIGAVHAQMATNCGLTIAACGDTIAEKANALAQRFGAEATTDCEALIQQDDIDIVAIATPTPTHAHYVVKAAQAGKAIFCEKPFCRTLEQCEAAIEAVKTAGVKLFIAHVVRYFHEFEAIKAQIEGGQIGRPGFVKCYRGGIYPMGENGWFRDYAQSGGVTLDSSVHDFDWVRYVFGDPERVYCQALQRPEPLDYALTTFRMKSGVIAHVIGTWAHPTGFRVKVEVCGDNGMVTYDSNEAPLEVMKRATEGSGPSMIVPGSPVAVSPYQREWEDFIAWLREERPPRVTPEDGAWSLRMALGALESAASGEPVSF